MEEWLTLQQRRSRGPVRALEYPEPLAAVGTACLCGTNVANVRLA